jgi:hypothetical protein
MQESLDLSSIGLRISAANSFTGYVAGKLMQFECEGQPLLTRHLAIPFDLSSRCL